MNFIGTSSTRILRVLVPVSPGKSGVGSASAPYHRPPIAPATADRQLCRPLAEIETLRQLHEHDVRRPFHHACRMSLAGQIIGYERLPGSALPLLIIAVADFLQTGQNDDDLTR